jgi:hypothetical protein
MKQVAFIAGLSKLNGKVIFPSSQLASQIFATQPYFASTGLCWLLSISVPKKLE